MPWLAPKACQGIHACTPLLSLTSVSNLHSRSWILDVRLGDWATGRPYANVGFWRRPSNNGLAQQVDILVDASLNGIKGVLGNLTWAQALGNVRKLARDTANSVNDDFSILH